MAENRMALSHGRSAAGLFWRAPPRKQRKSAQPELLPYHKFGFGKYEALGMDLPDAAFGTPTKEKMEHLKGILREIGISLADFK